MKLEKDSHYQMITVQGEEYRVTYLETTWSRVIKSFCLLLKFSDEQVDSIPVSSIQEIRSID